MKQYAVHKYDQDLVIDADRFELRQGHTQTSGSFSGGSSNTWTDAVFFVDGNENPVAFVHQPYSVVTLGNAPEAPAPRLGLEDTE